MKQLYFVRCPECNLALKKVESIDEISREPFICYGCDTEVNTIDDECIETIFLPSIQPSPCSDAKDVEVKWDNKTTSKEVICLLDNQVCTCHGYRPECNKRCHYCGSIRELDQINEEYYVCKTCLDNIEKTNEIYSKIVSQEEKDIDRTVESLKKFNLYRSISEGLNEAIEYEQDKNTHVYCTNCFHFRLSDDEIPYCYYENKCDIYDCEDSRPFKDRPYYNTKE